MPSRSPLSVPVPHVGLPSFIFGSPSAPLPTRPILVDCQRPDSLVLSLSSYRQWSKRVAAGLIRAGLNPGDRVLLFSDNSVFVPVIMLGVIMAGGIYTGADLSYSTSELASQLEDAAPRFFIAEGRKLNVAIEAAAIAGIGKKQVFLFDESLFDGNGRDEEDTRHWQHLIADTDAGDEFAWQELRSEEEANQTAAIVYTSGTSGIFKGIEVSHLNYVANCTQLSFAVSFRPAAAEEIRGSRYLCMTSMHRVVSQTIFAVIFPQGDWGTGYIMPKFEYAPMLDNIDKFQITQALIGPAVLDALARDPLLSDRSRSLRSLPGIRLGGARVRTHMGRDFVRMFGALQNESKLRVDEAWGMTETTGGFIADGHLLPNGEAKVMDFSGEQEASVGQRGELWVRGPTVVKGYWQNINLTREKLTPDGWLKTGDVAQCDEKDMFSLIDRVKDLITTRDGVLIPTEVEEMLMEENGVLDAGIVESPGDGPQKIGIYIVRIGQKAITEPEIMDVIWKKVPEARSVLGGVNFVDEIPRNVAGKIMRRLLRERARFLECKSIEPTHTRADEEHTLIESGSEMKHATVSEYGAAEVAE